MKVVLYPQADAAFLLAQQRYTDASQVLGRRFYDEITSVFSRIIEHPLRYKQFDPPARRLFANGFHRRPTGSKLGEPSKLEFLA